MQDYSCRRCAASTWLYEQAGGDEGAVALASCPCSLCAATSRWSARRDVAAGFNADELAAGARSPLKMSLLLGLEADLDRRCDVPVPASAVSRGGTLAESQALRHGPGVSETRTDFQEILRLVRPRARVLDVGCGEGELLDLLRREKGVDGRGIEISPQGVAACLAKGLSVMQGDADRDLAEYPPDGFDYVVLSDTLQAVKNPRAVLEAMVRLAERALVSFPNFGHWRVRASLTLRGRMPATRALPNPWWSTPNIHLCTVADFAHLAADIGLRVEATAALNRGKAARPVRIDSALTNLMAEEALVMLQRPARPALTSPSARSPAVLPGRSPATGDLFG